MMQIAEVELEFAPSRHSSTAAGIDGLRPQRPPRAYAPPGHRNRSPVNKKAISALDNNPNTTYVNFGGAGTGMIVELTEPAAVDAVALTSSNMEPHRDPLRVKIEGLNDAGEYIEVADLEVPPFAGRGVQQLLPLAYRAPLGDTVGHVLLYSVATTGEAAPPCICR
jgi:hypothetical protein